MSSATEQKKYNTRLAMAVKAATTSKKAEVVVPHESSDDDDIDIEDT